MRVGLPKPKCPFDGMDCEQFGFCDVAYFEDGKVTEQWVRCSRFKPRKALWRAKRK